MPIKLWMMRLARGWVGRIVVSWVVARSWVLRLLTMTILHETDTLTAFTHPRPSYPVHILIVPKRPFHTLLDIPDGDPFTADLFTTTQKLVHQHNLDQTAYRLVSNGGEYQDVPHLHFHLIGE